MFLERMELTTPEPCSEAWDAMRGDSRQRYCEECAKTVHNLAGLTRREVELLAMRADAGERVCCRITRDIDGSVVLRGDAGRGHGLRSGSVLLSAAIAAALPAAAQMTNVAPGASAVSSAGMARVTGRLLKPDGSPVDTGLIAFGPDGGSTGFYVADSSGRFEFEAPPGLYDFVVQTGSGQAQHMPVVALHEGEQSFGDVRTEAGRSDLDLNVAYSSTGGALSSTISWSWHGRLRHPLLYVRSVLRKLS